MKPAIDLWIWNWSDELRPTLADWAAAGVRSVLLKAADGPHVWPQFAAHADEIRALGMQAWAWHYVYGLGEPENAAAERVAPLADGYILDAEIEWERGGFAPSPLVGAIHQAAPGKPVLQTSFGQADLHRGMRWGLWDTVVDGFIPEVFPSAWNLSIPEALTRMYQSYEAVGVHRPLYPAAYLYEENNPVVDPAAVAEFMAHAEAGGYDTVSFWRLGIMGYDCLEAIRSSAAPTLEDRVKRIEDWIAGFGR